MYIAITGSQNLGKSTLIDDMIAKWPVYKKADNSYREKAKNDPRVKLNKEGTEESQTIIRDALIDQVQHHQAKNDKHVLFDRCTIDNLVYSLWLNAKGVVSESYIAKQIVLFKETIKPYDIIFFIPLLEKYDIPIVPDESGQRDLDPGFRKEIDNLFRALLSDYYKTDGRVFFPQEDVPAIVEVFGSREERIEMIKLYVNENGDMYGEEDSLISESLEDVLKDDGPVDQAFGDLLSEAAAPPAPKVELYK